MTTVVLAVAGFAAAAWLGMRVGSMLCADRTPFADGPAAVRVRPGIVMLAMGAVGAAAALHGSGPWQLVTIGLVASALAGCVAADCACGIVPDALTLVPLAGLVAAFGLRGDPGPLLAAGLVALPFAFAATLSHGRGMGWGDVKLAALGGALLGARGATAALVIACVVAYAWSRFAGGRTRPIAFAPYLVGGIAVVLIAGYGG